MKSLFRRLFGIFVVLATASMIVQGTNANEGNESKELTLKEFKELIGTVRIGSGVKNVLENLPEHIEMAVDRGRKKMLAAVDKQILFHEDCGNGNFYLVTLEPALEENVRFALELTGAPKFIEKMPILGMKFIGGTGIKLQTEAVIPHDKDIIIPLAMLINPERFSKHLAWEDKYKHSDPVDNLFFYTILFDLFREGGHIKAYSSGVLFKDNGDVDEELNIVVADTYGLAATTKLLAQIKGGGEEERRKHFSENSDLCGLFYLDGRGTKTNPYLNCYELVYYAKQLWEAQLKGGNFDALAYARKIIADRKKDGYGQRIMKEAKKASNLISDITLKKMLDSVDKRNEMRNARGNFSSWLLNLKRNSDDNQQA